MLDNFEYEDNLVEFFDIQNLYFDHPLSIDELNELKEVLFGFSNLSQMYFKEDVDLKSIEKVKNLILMSSTIKDSKIEKIVTCNLKDNELYKFVSSRFENPDTWTISYYHDGTNYYVDTIPNVRELLSYMKRIKSIVVKEELTPLEKVLRVYDIVKLIDYEDSNKEYTFPEIITSNKSNSKGFNRLFNYILKSINIDAFLSTIKDSDGNKNLINLVRIVDKKYNINGYYLFDPSMDTLPKESYKENLRIINYNYFGIKLEDFNLNKYGDTLTGVLSILSINNYDYAKERLVTQKGIKIKRELNKFLTLFNDNLNNIYNDIHKCNDIDIKVIIKLCESVYEGIMKDDFLKMIKSNYLDRNKDLFNPSIHDEFKKMLDND